MSKNTVKRALTPKRPKRVVENEAFDAFARRILRAYAHRVASGDVEALRALVSLSSELDAVTRLAVEGLRRPPYAYSWDEIGARLGVTRQAAQMRYGKRSNPDRLDRRLIEAGLSVTVATLVEVFADHHPGSPAAPACPACGYRYPDQGNACPTLTVVRPLLYRRRAEDKTAIARLSGIQLADLHARTSARTNRAVARQAARPAPSPNRDSTSLLDLIDGKDPTS